MRLWTPGLEQQWCAREGQGGRHGPYVARWLRRHIVVHGQYAEGQRIGLWSTWSASGHLLRVERDGRPAACE